MAISGGSARRVPVLLAACFAVLGLFVAPPAAADVETVEADSFYLPPEGLAQAAPGSVLRVRPIQVFGLPLPISAWQVLYRTDDSADRPVAGIATVMVPALSTPGARPLLSYQVAVDSLGARCAPSRALRGGWESGFNTLVDSPFMAAALLRGWAVVTSDYDGPDARFLDGRNAGRGVLDGIRAARGLGQGGLGPASPVGAYGYSGGAYATLWAAEHQPSYAPDVRFAGVAAGGVPADWVSIARTAEGTGQAGLAVLMLHAVVRNNPGLFDLLNDRGRAVLTEDATACGEELLPKYAGARLDDFTVAPNVLDHPDFRAALDAQELSSASPAAPTYLFHSTSDNVIPHANFRTLVDRYCALGADLAYRHSWLPGHNPAALGEVTGAMNFLADRFAARPTTPGCHPR
ncbi:lipase family protein [Nocardia takedensis]